MCNFLTNTLLFAEKNSKKNSKKSAKGKEVAKDAAKAFAALPEDSSKSKSSKPSPTVKPKVKPMSMRQIVKVKPKSQNAGAGGLKSVNGGKFALPVPTKPTQAGNNSKKGVPGSKGATPKSTAATLMKSKPLNPFSKTPVTGKANTVGAKSGKPVLLPNKKKSLSSQVRSDGSVQTAQSLEKDRSQLYRCLESYGEEGSSSQGASSPFSPFIGEPILIEYSPAMLDKVIIINSASVPCCTYSLGPTASLAAFTADTPTAATPPQGAFQGSFQGTPPQGAIDNALAADFFGASAGASMITSIVPPSRMESLGGSNLADGGQAPAEETAPPFSGPSAGADESLASSAGASMIDQAGSVPPPREESTGGGSAQ